MVMEVTGEEEERGLVRGYMINIIFKLVKKGRKERYLPNSCLQSAMEHKESRKNR
jgi:hypothetical protein